MCDKSTTIGPLVPTRKSTVTIGPPKGKVKRTENVASSQKEGEKSDKVWLCPIFEGLATEDRKRKKQDVMVQMRGGSATPHTPLSSVFCTLTCYSFELCALSGLSPHVQYDQFRPCRIFLSHFCPRNKKNFHFQQRNKMDFHFGRKKDSHFGSWSLCHFHFQEERNESHFHFRFFLDACGKSPYTIYIVGQKTNLGASRHIARE